MRCVLGLALVVELAPLLASGCNPTREAQAQAEDAPVAPAPRPAPTSSPRIARPPMAVEVPGDKAVLVVPGDPSQHRPIVHLHGMCADPRRNLEAWGGVAKDHGTIIALIGDMPCPGREGRTKWSEGGAKIDARVAAAIEAVNTARGTTLETSEVLVVGESMGAARAESLAKANPDRYARLVLVGSPRIVSPANVRGARAIANVAGEYESQQTAKLATRSLSQAGFPSQFWELAGAPHGEYGPDGQRIMSEAIGFVATQ